MGEVGKPPHRRKAAALTTRKHDLGTEKIGNIDRRKLTDYGKIHAVIGPDHGGIYHHELVSAVRRFAGKGTGDMRWQVPCLGVFCRTNGTRLHLCNHARDGIRRDPQQHRKQSGRPR